MDQNFQNKAILITGSTDGLGKLTAIELAKLDANIIIHGRNQDKINSALEEVRKINPNGKHDFVLCDFTKPETIDEAFDKLTNLDILINNAGVWAEGATIDLKSKDIINLVNTNTTSTLVLTNKLLPLIMKSEFGQILNIVSIAGIEIPTDYFHTFYTASKFALQGFTESLIKEFDNSNVRIMGIYPGGMSTSIFDKFKNDYSRNEDWMFNPSETVDAIIFMLSRNKKVNLKRIDIFNHIQGDYSDYE